MFTGLRVYRSERFTARWCAFLGTTAATARPGEALAAALSAETDPLTTRLRRLAEPVAGPYAEALARHPVLIVSGVLAMMLREAREKAIDPGEEAARIIVAASTRRQSSGSSPAAP